MSWQLINTLRPGQNGCHFADGILKYIFLNENVWISFKFSPNFVPKVQINNIPALVQIMDWRRVGDKPLSEPMMISLPTHICVTQPQWVNVTRTHTLTRVMLWAHQMFVRQVPEWLKQQGWLGSLGKCALPQVFMISMSTPGESMTNPVISFK